MNDAQALLVTRYLHGDADEQERAEVRRLLAADPRLVTALYREALQHSELAAFHRRSAVTAPATSRTTQGTQRARPLRLARSRTALRVAAAALVLLTLTAATWLAWPVARNQVLAGRVLVDGTAVSAIPDGASFTVAERAQIRLGDGSQLDLRQATTARIRSQHAGVREHIDLSAGGGGFAIAAGGGRFVVATEVATVTVLGTRFTLGLEERRGRPVLRAAVSEGRVEVVHGDQRVVLGSGEARVFGEETERTERPAPSERRVRGTIAMVDDEAPRFAVLTGDGRERKRQLITVTEDTRITRNEAVVGYLELRVGDEVLVVFPAGRAEHPLSVSATGSRAPQPQADDEEGAERPPPRPPPAGERDGPGRERPPERDESR